MISPATKADRFRIGFLFRPGSFWVGAHWSGVHKRLCLNLLPMCTIWFVDTGGDLPPKEL